MKPIDKKMIFLAGCLLFAIFFIYRMLSPVVFNTNIKMTIIKQKGDIITLDTPIVPDFTNTYYINTINFKQGSILDHNDIGNFSYTLNFYLFLYSTIHVEKDGLYLFTIASDDGFRLKLNDRLIGEFISNRAFGSNQYNVFLARGYYKMELSYFQGYGLQGLTAQYKYQDSARDYYFGENSPYMYFSR